MRIKKLKKHHSCHYTTSISFKLLFQPLLNLGSSFLAAVIHWTMALIRQQNKLDISFIRLAFKIFRDWTYMLNEITEHKFQPENKNSIEIQVLRFHIQRFICQVLLMTNLVLLCMLRLINCLIKLLNCQILIY